MPSFALAAQTADATGLPVVEAVAVKLKPGISAASVKAAKEAIRTTLTDGLGDEVVQAEEADGWLISAFADSFAPTLGEAWEVVRTIKNLPDVETAEPLLLTRAPVTNGSDAQESFKLWGKVSAERLAAIQKASDRANMHWSLDRLGVGDAWNLWRQKHGISGEPGAGVVVAHPDTGYTEHPRLLPALKPQSANSQLRGRDFVDRNKPDALDPMKEQGLLHFPGHGTSTASIIVGANAPADKPWGVAPGAKILPLRVSASVIHLSFRNVCDAFDEAMRQGADIISMSLGGPIGSELLNDRVEKALAKGIIIVSAAGNYAPTVVFPAKIPGVLACAASNALTRPWRFSGMGEEVGVTAPGELVWHDWSRTDGSFSEVNGNGTSFATANVAGLAALWLSYWGRANLLGVYGGDAGLIPFGFRDALEKSSRGDLDFVKGGGFGKGIPDARKLLSVPLEKASAERCRRRVLDNPTAGFVSFPVSSWWSILTLPTITAAGPTLPAPEERGKRDERLAKFIADMIGATPTTIDPSDLAELGALAGTDIVLHNALARIAQGSRGAAPHAAVRRYLLRSKVPLSNTLRAKLEAARVEAQKKWNAEHTELFKPPEQPSPGADEKKSAYALTAPATRRLRAFAFDPSLATKSDAVAINEITIPVVFEPELQPGPVGDYLEVVDVDPASDCAYAPVDLNHRYLLAQDGLPRSEGNPQFHQQMVYAVGMKTIAHFEEALGRPIFWSPLRPWNEESGDADRAAVLESGGSYDQFVQRLRLYPHALRDQNAYYSPQKRAILFGYFPADDNDPGAQCPGGVVFTCLAHDIIAHEMTHALLDGMHVHFTEPTNPDVFAFHEAFADIVALFQRFTYPELLRDQIARARGRLEAGTLMTQLALQFGEATGRHQALRDALGHVVQQSRERGDTEWRDRPAESETDGSERRPTIADTARDLGDEETRLIWKRFHADPSLVAQVEEPHERGSFLVAAVFDAYLTIYEARVADLRRIATGGTGILPDGDLHPDLVNRMANEAAKSARHVLKLCIRAMDYTPPVDITFGEFLRALITADADLVPDDPRRYRVAFIEAFRKWGIYPRDVRTLSEESLRWSPPPPGRDVLFPNTGESATEVELIALRRVRQALLGWQPGKPRQDIFEQTRMAQGALHDYLAKAADPIKLDEKTRQILRELMSGVDPGRPFQVTNLRPSRRIGPHGEFRTEMVVEIIQDKQGPALNEGVPGRKLPFRGGVTLVVDMDEFKVRYAIYKRPDSVEREARQVDFLLRAGHGKSADAAEYSSENLPAGWFTNAAIRKKWSDDRLRDREAMRASSCACRRVKMEEAEKKAAARGGIPVLSPLTEPFALLHQD